MKHLENVLLAMPKSNKYMYSERLAACDTIGEVRA